VPDLQPQPVISKRRIKTQTVLPSADTPAMLFWALLASGQINMRKVDGWQTLATKPWTSFPRFFRGTPYSLIAYWRGNALRVGRDRPVQSRDARPLSVQVRARPWWT
jgi:hypothetical protein